MSIIIKKGRSDNFCRTWDVCQTCYIRAGLFTVIKTQMVAGDEGFYPVLAKKKMHRIRPPVCPQPCPVLRHVLQHVLQRSHLGFISLVFHRMLRETELTIVWKNSIKTVSKKWEEWKTFETHAKRWRYITFSVTWLKYSLTLSTFVLP